jgi:hypothetical protein
MIAHEDFLKFRHRKRGPVFVATVVLGNALIGLGGAMYALHDRNASVKAHVDFLPLALAAVFGGNAVMVWWLSRKLRASRSGDSLAIAVTDDQREDKGTAQGLLRAMRPVRDDSTRIGALFFTYLLGCLFLTVISGLVQANAFTVIHPALRLPQNLHYAAIACLFLLCVWFAREKER